MSEPKDSDPAQQPQPQRPSIFTVPEPIRRLFNRFPLHTYPLNDLPARCATTNFAEDETPVLYVFSDWEAVARGAPSFNPLCLKWQTYLKMSSIKFHLHPSTNHSSPSGALPFLQTPHSAIPSSKLPLYTQTHSPSPLAPPPPQSSAYASLLDTPIRLAYLHSLYLAPANTPLLAALYASSTSNPPVRALLLRQLRSAAEDEILTAGGSPVIDADAIYRDASDAFAVLERLLGGREWFFEGRGDGRPTEFDAAVFAYMNVILGEELGWVDPRLGDIARDFPGLVKHRLGILARYWPELV